MVACMGACSWLGSVGCVHVNSSVPSMNVLLEYALRALACKERTTDFNQSSDMVGMSVEVCMEPPKLETLLELITSFEISGDCILAVPYPDAHDREVYVMRADTMLAIARTGRWLPGVVILADSLSGAPECITDAELVELASDTRIMFKPAGSCCEDDILAARTSTRRTKYAGTLTRFRARVL